MVIDFGELYDLACKVTYVNKIYKISRAAPLRVGDKISNVATYIYPAGGFRALTRWLGIISAMHLLAASGVGERNVVELSCLGC